MARPGGRPRSVSPSRRRGSHWEERPRGVRSRARASWPWPLLRPGIDGDPPCPGGCPMRTRFHIRVDPIACDGRGLCAELLPELILLDDWGYPIIRDVDVPAELVREALEVVRVCPKLALRLEAIRQS